MDVKHISVEGFRGIRHLEWSIDGVLVGLIGPGDSTKTTILDAIEYALSPRWTLPISDSDFHGGHATSPIRIEVTVGHVPRELLEEEKFGFYVRGWRSPGELVDEPGELDESVLTIRLKIDTDLEPSWAVVAERHAEAKPITSRDRSKIGVVRLGADVNRDLAWGKGSSLSRMTDPSGIEGALADAYRAARETLASGDLTKLAEVAESVAHEASPLGVMPEDAFVPALDPSATSFTSGTLSLHDGKVPVRAKGLGTRRLVAVAIQQAIVQGGAILLIDELEHGLEPHRIRRFIRHLRRTTACDATSHLDCPKHGQVIITTHSPVAVLDLNVSEIRVVRSRAGETRVLTPPASLQPVLRALPEAFLGRRVVVCEGATEVGMCWGMEDYWRLRNSGESTGCRGVLYVDGGGDNAPSRARSLANLGYAVSLFSDSDCITSATFAELSSAGVNVVAWNDALCTEQRVFKDLPLDRLQQALDLAIELNDKQLVLAAVANCLGVDQSSVRSDIKSWVDLGASEQKIREALGLAAKGNRKGNSSAWYKRYDKAQLLAAIVVDALPEITGTDLATKLQSLEDWCYA